MSPILLNIIGQLAPIFLAAIKRFQTRTGSAPTTKAELMAEFQLNGQAILDEGAAWEAAHPTT